jgi:hypothetical protein
MYLRYRDRFLAGYAVRGISGGAPTLLMLAIKNSVRTVVEKTR